MFFTETLVKVNPVWGVFFNGARGTLRVRESWPASTSLAVTALGSVRTWGALHASLDRADTQGPAISLDRGAGVGGREGTTVLLLVECLGVGQLDPNLLRHCQAGFQDGGLASRASGSPSS